MFRFGRRMPCVVIAAAASLLSANSPFAQLADQPAGKHSTLVDKDGKGIRDDEFAEWIKDLLVPGGTVDVRDAKIIFQECYGGGMLDDLEDALSNVKWVGGSASKHDEPSIGQVSPEENATEGYDKKWEKDPPEDWWTGALDDQLAQDQTVLKSLEEANKNDGANKQGNGKLETGQSVTANGGETIKLDDPGAASHHAILWAGDADHMRHFNDIKNIRAALLAKWGPTGANVTITTLFGDGAKDSEGNDLPADWNAKEATKANLKAEIAALQGALNTNEQFFFYASNHGGVETDPVDTATPVPGNGGSLNAGLSLSVGEVRGMLGQSDNQPLVTVDHQGGVGTGTVDVLVNGTLVGSLGGGTGGIEEFPVAEGLLNMLGANQLSLVNNDPSTLTVNRLSFFTGGIDMNPPGDGWIPTMSQWGLIFLGLLLLGLAAWMIHRNRACFEGAAVTEG